MASCLALIFTCTSVHGGIADSTGIHPLVVSVVDERGEPVPGAVVTIQSKQLDAIAADPMDSLSRFARMAAIPSTTDRLGFAVAYIAGGRALNTKERVYATGINGVITIEALGYKKFRADLSEEFGKLFSHPEKSAPLYSVILPKKEQR